MSKILITAAHTATALKFSKAFAGEDLVLGDYGTATELKIASYTLVSLDKFRKNAIAHNLLAKCLDLNIRILVPVYFEEIEALSTAILLFEEYGITVIVPEAARCATLPKITQAANWILANQGEILFSAGNFEDNLNTPADRGVFAWDSQTKVWGIYGVHYYQKTTNL
jgi:hypothetical protein